MIGLIHYCRNELDLAIDHLSQAQHNTFQSIFIMLLLALVYEKRGRFEEALTVLKDAVNLAGRGRFIRPFLKLGPTMTGLLKRLAQKNIAVDFIGHLLDALSPPPIRRFLSPKHRMGN